MRIVFFGSGAFGLPTLAALGEQCDVVAVVTQPDRPAGRRRMLTPTPVGEWAERNRLEVLRLDDVNAKAAREMLRSIEADAWVVIAFGQKLSQALLADRFAINLHASLLPKYRGAAPINRAMMAGERQTGVSVITLAERMDAGLILATRATPIRDLETAGELHDRLAALGPDAVAEVLHQHAAGTLHPQEQDESLATKAPKLTKAEGTTSFTAPADLVRARVHGLTPWPGCTVLWQRAPDDARPQPLLLRRVTAEMERNDRTPPGVIRADGSVACGSGAIMPVEVQVPGRSAMAFHLFCNGHSWQPGGRLLPLEDPEQRGGSL